MTTTTTVPIEKIPFKVEYWAAWWAKPDMATVGAPLSPDIVGYWPGEPSPVRGQSAYTGKIGQLLQLIPTLRLELLEHAQNGNAIFIHYTAHITNSTGDAFKFNGIDRILLDENGFVKENVIRFDLAQLMKAVWSSTTE